MPLKFGLLTLGVAVGVTLHAQSHSLQDVLARAGEYHTTYTKKMSGVSLEEQTQLMNVSGDVTRGIVRISADVVLVNVGGQAESLRDVYAIDTRPTRERTPRILQLLGAPARPSIKDWQTAITYPGQDVFYFLLDIVVKTNEPTAALQFIAAANQPNLKYKLDGRKTMNNVAVVAVRFEEPEARERRYLLGTRSNGRATGRIWIDPLTGAVHQTELWVESMHERTYTESASVAVKYTPHAALGLLLPSESNATFEEFDASGMRQIQTGASAAVAIDGRVSLQSRSTYSNATFAAIDLARFSGQAEQPQWVSLFDGKTIEHWRGFKMTTVPDSWIVEEGAITWTKGAAVDLVSREQFTNFEFEFDWKVPPGGNSGIMFRVTEDLDRTYHSGPEFQILDNARHSDGKNPMTSAAANHSLHAPTRDMCRPVGEWNQGRLVVNGNHVEHWLNGEKVVEYDLFSEDWTKRLLASKFKDVPRYGREPRGHLVLQEHGSRIQYKNLRIKKLP